MLPFSVTVMYTVIYLLVTIPILEGVFRGSKSTYMAFFALNIDELILIYTPSTFST